MKMVVVRSLSVHTYHHKFRGMNQKISLVLCTIWRCWFDGSLVTTSPNWLFCLSSFMELVWVCDVLIGSVRTLKPLSKYDPVWCF